MSEPDTLTQVRHYPTAASKLYEQRLGDFGKDDPATIGCLPSAPVTSSAGRRRTSFG